MTILSFVLWIFFSFYLANQQWEFFGCIEYRKNDTELFKNITKRGHFCQICLCYKVHQLRCWYYNSCGELNCRYGHQSRNECCIKNKCDEVHDTTKKHIEDHNASDIISPNTQPKDKTTQSKSLLIILIIVFTVIFIIIVNYLVKISCRVSFKLKLRRPGMHYNRKYVMFR